MTNLLVKMEIFYQVVLQHSFSKAGQALGISKGYVSLQINELEQELGMVLLHRSTRQLKLTAAGELFFQSCQVIMQEKKLACAQLEELKTEPAGTLTISAPPSMCGTMLAAILPDFINRYPTLSVTVDSSASIEDLYKGNIDIALRITKNPQPQYVARLIASFKFIICASTKYLQQYGTPKIPQDLLTHNCLIYSTDPAAQLWPFEKNQQVEEISVQGNVKSNNINIIQQALFAGKGIARLPGYLFYNQPKPADIHVLLEEYNVLLMPIYAVYLTTARNSPKIKVFLDYLKR
jgi:DNA-binding transcriptional LysR family regulator